MTRIPRFDLPSRAYFARCLDEHARASRVTLRELGDALKIGGNNLTMWRTGQAKIPMDRIGELARAVPTLDELTLTLLRLEEEQPAVPKLLERELPAARLMQLARWFEAIELAYGVTLEERADPREREAAELSLVLACAIEDVDDYPVEPYDPALRAARQATAARILAQITVRSALAS